MTQAPLHRRRHGLVLAAAVLALATVRSPAGPRFTDEVWDANRDIYEQILAHPFLKGLVDGSLERETFVRYLVQDAFYLGEFADVLRAAAAKAPRPEWRALLEQHARDSVQEEMRLHRSVFEEFGVSAAQASAEPLPDPFAYTSFLVATAHRGTFAEAMAAVLPCYWIYWEVGRELQKQGSREPFYQKWIDAYASPEYGESVEAVLAIVNEVASTAGPQELATMRAHFRRSARYEWMFWNAAYEPGQWPPVP